MVGSGCIGQGGWGLRRVAGGGEPDWAVIIASYNESLML